VAERMGVSIRKDTKMRVGILGAEPWTAEMRNRIQDWLGIKAYDIYGTYLKPGKPDSHYLRMGKYATVFGNAEENPEHFTFMMAYSPLHNIKKGVAHPPTLITTADHDDRVAPAHSFKFAATLQELDAGKNPILAGVSPIKFISACTSSKVSVNLISMISLSSS
jgi:hypothetical protein